jgi:pyruvate kinase
MRFLKIFLFPLATKLESESPQPFHKPHRSVSEAETHFLERGVEPRVNEFEQSDAASMARAAQVLANDQYVTAVACFTTQGKTAWLMSKIRPRVPIIAFSPSQNTYRQLA